MFKPCSNTSSTPSKCSNKAAVDLAHQSLHGVRDSRNWAKPSGIIPGWALLRSVDGGLNACYIPRSRQHRAVGIVHKTQFAAGGLRRWIALNSLLLVLVFNGLEATHTHVATSDSSSRCAVCISVHGNAPPVAVHPLPVLCAVATVAARHQAQKESITTEPTLFIRPPPAI